MILHSNHKDSPLKVMKDEQSWSKHEQDVVWYDFSVR